jgi:hypothetical protein
MGERQPDVQRYESGFGAGAEQGETKNCCANDGGKMGFANRSERITAGGTRQQTKAEQQRQCSEAGHQQIDVARSRVARLSVMRHDERPRGERHEFPARQERERVVGKHDKIHPGEKCGKEGQHATGFPLVPPVAKAVEACRRGAQIDDHEKRRGQRIKPKMRTQPRQSNGQVQRLYPPGIGYESPGGGSHGNGADA